MAYLRGRYYYRSRREGRRVVTEYLGAGELAQAIAQLDVLEQWERAQERAAIRAERAREREVDRNLDAAGDLLRLLAQATLLVNGYHAHKGQWRRRRDGGNARATGGGLQS